MGDPSGTTNNTVYARRTAIDIEAELARTTYSQNLAADPQASVWVSANAGTGKTHVLTNRTLRLMLSGTPPERILCLTYTKAAAAEMSTRVFNQLSKWVTADDEVLTKELAALLGRQPSTEEQNRARRMFTSAIETPGGLKVQTIHAFCERLLQRFPLEAGIPPGFSILDQDKGAEILREAVDAVLRTATSTPHSPLGKALTQAIAYAADDRFDEILSQALKERTWLENITRKASADPPAETAYALPEAEMRETMSVRPDITVVQLDQQRVEVLEMQTLKRLINELSATGKKSDQAGAAHLTTVANTKSVDTRNAALAGFFLTGKGEKRKNLMTKAVKDANPDLEQSAARAQEHFERLTNERLALDVVNATMALVVLSSAVMQNYSEAKARRAALDFEDLITRTASLLATSESAEWVLYKLDGGLDHILVDESQDTSPSQWNIVQSLAHEFFAGTGAREADRRTLFAVGDEKQSIYSFQGAAPEKFGQMGQYFKELAESSAQTWCDVPLNLSFRSVAPILQAVDDVFSGTEAPANLGASRDFIAHVARRIGHAGLVEVWPTEKPTDLVPTDTWSPLDETSALSPPFTLAKRIATTIKGWLDTGERLPSSGRNVTAGDIIILVRKRQPFAAPMVSALKELGIPVAGADRINLLDQIGVQDLVALGDFVTLPEDDLSLAAILKSPFFSLDDDDLFKIAHGRKGTLWKALLAQRDKDDRFAEAIATLIRWRSRADFIPPYEFFAQVLDRDQMRARLLTRLGPEAADAIDEFETLAIGYDEGAPPTLSGFLSWLRSSTREIKRDMEHGQDQVRVMTVHGAKGLEAPIVFLPDTCSGSSPPNRGGLQKLNPNADGSTPHIWQIKGASRLVAISAAASQKRALEEAEHNRLLYVAMTRARDRLYVCGYEGARGRGDGCWYDRISAAMQRTGDEICADDERVLYRLEAEQSAEISPREQQSASSFAKQSAPDWSERKAPSEPQLTVPLAPSGLAPYETDDEGEPSATREPANLHPADIPSEPNALSPKDAVDNRRFLRGTLTHALLQHLPEFAAKDRRKIAQTFVDERAAVLASKTRKSIVDETLGLIDDNRLRDVFGPKSRAEVNVAAQIPRPSGKGPALRLAGQIDRLLVRDNEVLIIDYKTNRPPPNKLEGVADAYLLQLGAYSLALRQIYPDKTVRAAIIWTQNSHIMMIPDPDLAMYQAKIWDLDPARQSAT